MMRSSKRLGILLAFIGVCWSVVSYAEVSRSLFQNKGSDTMVLAVTAWSEAYKRVNPNAGVAITAGGSGTGIAALINGVVDIANSSRLMRDKELELAKKQGRNPVKYTVAHDAIAVYLHKDNPAPMVTLEQLAEIYGEDGKIEKWTDIGIEVPGCKDQQIIRVSRQNSSGTYALFRRIILGERRDYKLGSQDMQASKDTVALVGGTPCAIGYSSQVYVTDNVKMVCIAEQASGKCMSPSIDTIRDHSYPLGRPLYMYMDGEPQGELKKYLDWVLSDEGQCIVVKRGYAPVRPVNCGG
jgi:phosphate transport system substrate-binding protein